MKILKKLLPIIGLIYFGVSAFGQTRGVSYQIANTNVIQTVHQRFHSLTNFGGTAGELAIHNAGQKVASTNAAGVRGMLSVPIFDSIDPGAVNIFPFWDDAQNEVDWTSNTALLTLLGLDSNDDVTFGTVAATTVTATTLAGAGGGITYNGAGNNGNLANTVDTLQELNDAVDNLSIGGGGSAPVGTMVNSGASTQYAFPYYNDTTGTNLAPSLITTDATKTNLNTGGLNANVLVLTNLSESLSNMGLGTEDSPQFTGIELGHATDNTLTRPGAGRLAVEGNSVVLGAQQITIAGPTAARTITVPDANFTAARTDAANTFTGTQTITQIDVGNTDTSITRPAGGDIAIEGVNVLNNSRRTLTTSPGGADDTYAGVTFNGLNNSGGVTQWDVVYLNGSSQWVLADANGSGTFPARGLAVATVATANATTVLEDGVVRNDAWTWTPGGTIYLSTTAGGLTQTAPSTTGDKIQVIGYAIDADTMRVKISADYGTAP